MKYLINLIIILLYNTTSFAQDPIYTVKVKDTCYSFNYSEELKDPLDDFFKHAQLYSYPMDSISNLHGIYRTNVIYYYTGTNAAGLTMLSRDFKDFIFINENIELYLPTFIESILYHEFYHLLANNKDHCSDIFCPYILQDGRAIDVEKVIRTWNEDSKKEYFEYLKRN